MNYNDKVSGWPMVLAVPLRVASPLDWLVIIFNKNIRMPYLCIDVNSMEP